MSDAELLLEVKGIAKRYGAVVALRDASLQVRGGEVHALMGANGAGKSTLVKILTGAVQPDAGEIILRGERREVHSPAEARRTGLVSVYQEPSVVPDLTVEENLALTGTPLEPFHERVAELGIEDLDMRARARELPLATQRVIDLARALSTDPDVLLLDEMTAALPANLTERVLEVVRARHESGRSVIFISHRLLEISAICDRATVLRDGETVGVVDIGPGAEEQIVALMLGATVGRVAEAARPSPTAAAGPAPSATDRPVPRLAARNLAAGTRLHDVSFEMHAGEVLGVAALEGQGQDELFEVLSGSMRPTAGEVQVNGRRARFGHPADAIRVGIVFVPADRALAVLRQRSVRENIALPFYARPPRWGPIDMAAEGRDVGGAIDRLQIDTRAGAEVQRLSGGNQQKVTIARWIAGGVETLLCFDPTRGIDIGTKREIYQLLRDLAAGGAAVLLYTSELDEIPQVCDRTVVIYRGRVVEEVARHEADEPTLLRAAYGMPRGTKLPEEVALAEAAADVTGSRPGASA